MTKRREGTVVLVVHRGLLSRRDDVAEIEQQIAGLLEASAGNGDVTVLAGDGHDVFAPVLHGADVEYVPLGPFRLCLGRLRPDVAFIHMPVPLVHLGVAAALSAVGTRIVLAPMAMLERPYARASWFRRRSVVIGVAKRVAVAALRRSWRLVADEFVCLSTEEVRETGLPPDRCLLVPWTAPPTALGAAAAHAGAPPDPPGPGAPAAFISRLDVRRKGIDRLCTWLLEKRDDLPRPAVILFAPPTSDVPEALAQAMALGLVRWDDSSTGADLLPALRSCRCAMLLSRWEAQARAIREAMLLGLPTLAARPCHLEEVVGVLGAGEIVDADDVDAIHAAYVRIAGQQGDTVAAARLFDRARIGSFLLDALLALAGGGSTDARNAYEDLARGTVVSLHEGSVERSPAAGAAGEVAV